MKKSFQAQVESIRKRGAEERHEWWRYMLNKNEWILIYVSIQAPTAFEDCDYGSFIKIHWFGAQFERIIMGVYKKDLLENRQFFLDKVKDFIRKNYPNFRFSSRLAESELIDRACTIFAPEEILRKYKKSKKNHIPDKISLSEIKRIKSAPFFKISKRKRNLNS